MKTKLLSLFLVVVMLVTMFSFGFATKVNAATTYGYGFASTPIKVFSGYQLNTNQVNILKQAIAKWNSTRLGTLLTYGGVKNVFNPTLADGWNTLTVGRLSDGVAGETRVYTNGSHIVEANILIDENNFDVSVVMHELGHLLGLKDNNYTASVMCFVNQGSTTITASDLADLDSLY
ncbi:MAG: hypothetical protein IJX34_01045 [Clostridia bacterium]|nr:hypothetical protein [Clostridia bacterium]